MVITKHYTISLLLFVLIAAGFCKPVAAQKYSVHGYIREKSSSESLPGATVSLSDRSRGTVANNYGYFSLLLEQGQAQLIVSFSGYQSQQHTILIKSDTLINFYLEPITLSEVVVEAQRTDMAAIDPNRTILSMQQIKQIPPFLGEYDIMKGLALTAGVNTGSDGSSGIHVRGGTPDQNLVLLDGATVYNNNHLFGFFSVFNPEAIQSVEIIKGGFPARYGGRLSSVVNVSMKEGNKEKIKSSLSLGPLSSQFTIDGPLNKGKSTFMWSMRSAYLSLISLPSMYMYRYPATGVNRYYNYYLYDMNAKFNHSFSPKQTLYLSFYSGRDVFLRKERWGGEETASKFGWGNKTASARFVATLSPRLFSETMASVNTFNFNNSALISDQDTSIKKADDKFFSRGSGVFDASIRQRLEYTLSDKHKLTGGIELQRQSLTPDQYKISENILPAGYASERKNRYLFHTTAFYVEDFFSTQHLTLRSGIRMAVFYVGKTKYFSPEPRFNLEVPINANSAITLAYSFMKQPIHLLSQPTQGIPIDVWVPVTENMPPQQSHQVSAGYSHSFPQTPYKISLATYYKPSRYVIDYQTGLDYAANLTGKWEEMIETNGIGKAYGLELMIEKTTGRFNGWIAYTLARNQKKFANINNGEWYDARYDRRHDLNLVASYQITPKWKVSSTFTLYSGLTTTIPTAYMLDIYGNEIPVYTKRNNYRMPLYHRLDIAFTKDYVSKRGRKSSFSFGAFNAYGRANPQYLSLNSSSIYGPNYEYLGFINKYQTGTLFGFIPFFNYNVNF